ncbi:recombinase family protein [Conexibacter sp. JD483]|uniref:recombinase family protein n=1 Tax=unclassified Conexibacter TaxID=2627773 RepID=UPI002720AC71|nr:MULTISPECIES: recombinase family protein [unclassified Conexibacter]MDO8184682.1 recombinase family protein [Conexibacter sp. CPCC 205706]MDO8197988.1 recombinase family protein [Conexibacter sp. CPCC 205762]MDR9368418.1 recombinase family protein [Conexibacter sp. JD483]
MLQLEDRRTMTTNSTLDGYIRVSRRGRRTGERFISPGEQRKAIERWARENDARILRWHTDMSRSGGTMERRGLRAAINRLEKGQTGGIVVACLDRFSRTAVGGMAAIEKIDRLGGRVVSVKEHVDPYSATGRLHLGLILVIAEWQRATAAESFELAIRNAAERGLFAKRTSYGLMKDETGRLVHDPETVLVAQRIVTLRASGRGWAAIAAQLTRDEIPTPTGKTRWSKTTLIGIVQSESLIGVWNGPFGLRLENAWEPIVDVHLWQKANAVRGIRDDARAYNDRTFAGLARCARCRRVLTREVNNTGYVSYGCAIVGCRAVAVGAHLLDDYVTRLLDARLAWWRLRAERDDDGTIEKLAADKNRAEKEFVAWRDDTDLREVIGDADYREGLKARARRRDETEDALATARAARLGDAAEIASDLEVRLDDLEWTARRQIAEAAIHAIWVRPSRVRGPAAGAYVSERLLVEYIDSRNPHDKPDGASRAEPTPVTW